MTFVDIKNDIAFRKIFGNENRKEVLISFLNAVLLLQDKNRIVYVDILTPYQLPDIKGGKVTIVDVQAKDKENKTYIVEMQVADVEGFDKRVLYYASKSYLAQIDRGDEYEKLNPTYFIGILNFSISQNINYLSRHKIVDILTQEQIIKDIEFNFIELTKFNKNEDELETIIDQWTYFLKNAENLELMPENVLDKGLRFAYEDAAKHNWSKEELAAYDYVLMREQDDRGRFSKALRLGVAESIKNEKEKFALKLIDRNFTNEEIAEDTGLSIEQIIYLRENAGK